MQNYAVAHANSGQRTLRREGPWQEGFVRFLSSRTSLVSLHVVSQVVPPPPHVDKMTPAPQLQNSVADVPIVDRGMPTFGVDLAEQMTRDNVDIPRVMHKCCEAIEKWGLESKGIYRLSGTHSKIQKLKERLDRGQSFVTGFLFCFVFRSD